MMKTRPGEGEQEQEEEGGGERASDTVFVYAVSLAHSICVLDRNLTAKYNLSILAGRHP